MSYVDAAFDAELIYGYEIHAFSSHVKVTVHLGELLTDVSAVDSIDFEGEDREETMARAAYAVSQLVLEAEGVAKSHRTRLGKVPK